LKKRARIVVSRRPLSGDELHARSSIGSEKITVIVVDDDFSVCRALRTQLEILGFNVLLFQSAKKFLDSDIPSRDTCLLVDVYMPETSGVELCRQLRAEEVSLPIVLMSGRDDDETLKQMREAKPAAQLVKPFDQTTLLRAIKKAIRQSLQSSDG
jgi:FixJ family two-component response regulator